MSIEHLIEGAGKCANQASPSPQTIENLLDQRLNRLNEQLHQVVKEIMAVSLLKHRTPMAILRGSAADLRELNRYLYR